VAESSEAVPGAHGEVAGSARTVATVPVHITPAPGHRAGRFFEGRNREARCRAAGFAALTLPLALACGGGESRVGGAHPAGTPETGFRFVDVAQEAGINRVVFSGRPGKEHLLDSAGMGVAWLDYDRDGRLDAYIVNGWKLDGSRVVEKGRNALYRNRGDGTFEDVTDKAGVAGEGQWGSGVAVADYDGDSWPDILVTNFGPNVLYRNRGDGTFENVAKRAGIEAPGWNTGAAFFDADGDGHLDLYIAAYVNCTLDEVLNAKPLLDWKGVEKVAMGPFGLPGAADHFFLSDGKGGFRDATRESGMEDKALAYGFSVRAADLDNDGDPDLYVANDSDPNYVYRNEGHGKFTEVGLWSGAALSANGAAQAGMGVAVGDYNRDGNLDILVTNFAEDYSTLYKGDGKGFFQDVSEEAGIARPTFPLLSWGAVFADLDCDGDQDLVIVSGHIYPQVDAHPEFGAAYAQRKLLLENTGDGHFVDASGRAGPGFSRPQPGHGLAAGDYDNDGDLDLLVSNLDAPPNLLRNDSPHGSWLTVVLEAPPGGGPIIGTRIEAKVGGWTLVRDLASSESFLSVNDPRLHFGLGTARSVDELVVRWPDGTRTVLRDVAANRFITVKKGT
jgi:enediyne biosynthesis protein E4